VARGPRQLEFEFRSWGGVRSNAGRPPKGSTAGVSHLRRPSHSHAHPLHITLRVVRGLPSLREHSVFSVVRLALARGKQHFGFSLVHFSVQRDHLHLIAEANDRRALSRGMQGLSIRLARAVNARLGRTGRLFADRYHARALTTPRTVRFALRYVLLNVRKHLRGPSRPAAAPVSGFVDSCSSAPWFAHFERPLALAFGARAARVKWERESRSAEAPVVAPCRWLLRSGWQRAGPFDVDDVPG
jgi:REP element-mobilizing transposase RayT